MPWLFLSLIILIIIVMAGAISSKKEALEAIKTQSADASVPAISVVTQTIIPAPMSDRIDLPALVLPWEDLMVKTEVEGKIISVSVKEGDRVNKGQAIAQIDDRDYRNNLHAIQARQELATANFNRLKELAKTNAVTQAMFDEANAVFKEINAMLATAELNLERCEIKAPIAGVINNLPVRNGMLLAHSDPVAQILDLARLKVEVAIPESDVTAVSQVDSCPLILAALDNREIIGRKIFLASQPQFPSMVYTLRLAIDNQSDEIKPGMFARAKITKQTVNEALGIPLYAVLTEKDEKFVFIAQDNLARKIKVETGFMEGWKVRITSGLKPEDQVVIVGHRGLEDGQPVNIVKTITDQQNIGL